MRVTMKDVAKKANVSISTVSLVINQTGGISEETRQLVWRVIEELKYTPNAQARRLSSGQTGTVALVMPPWQAAFSDPYFLELMRGSMEAVRDRGYQMIVEVSDDRFLEHQLWRDLYASKKIDGFLIATPYLDQGYLEELNQRSCPTLLINGARPDLPNLDYVGYDDVRCGEDATNYLIGLGHRRIAHIAGSLNHASAINRKAGYRRALEAAGIPYIDDDVVSGEYMPLEARDALTQVLAHPADVRPTAFFCANDTMALSVMKHLQELGYAVPRDFSVIGVDDTGAAALAQPPLTTFRQDIFWLARTAADRFLEKLENKDHGTKIDLRPVMPLVERSSCATVRPRS